MKHGDFSNLAVNYSLYRPGYSPSVLNGLVGLLEKSPSNCSFADIGAGTGIWTRILHNLSPVKIDAVEPCDDMRTQGQEDSKNTSIRWVQGTGENTGLTRDSYDMVSMASSFHWVDFEKGCKEFHRILKTNGRFVALWNSRDVTQNPFLQELENYLYILKPDLKRVSSGSSGITNTLTEKLSKFLHFEDIVYIENSQINRLTPAQYIGAWRSVNDVQYQLGPSKFSKFLSYIEEQTKDIPYLEVPYKTRAWSARKKD